MFNVELKGLPELMKRIDPNKAKSAAKSSLERAKSAAKSEATRLAQKYWNISKRNLEYKASGAERIKVSGRVNDDLTATLTFYSGGISLAYFGAKEFRLTVTQSKATAKRMGQAYRKGSREMVGVKVQIQKGKTTTLRQFMTTVKYGKDKSGSHAGVFRRAGKDRLPIYESQSVGITTMISQPKIINPLRTFIADTFEKRMVHELTRRGVIN